MPNVIVIGETYGLPIAPLIKLEEYDKVIFMGNQSTIQVGMDKDLAIKNLVKKIHLKRDNPEKVELLIGPWDLRHLFREFKTEIILDEGLESMIDTLFIRYRHLFKVSFEIGDWLFTHAGVTKSWLTNHIEAFTRRGLGLSPLTFSDFLNVYMSTDVRYGIMEDGETGPPGPLFVSTNDVVRDRLPNINQVVGAGNVSKILRIGNAVNKTSVVLVNCLNDVSKEKRPEFFTITL